MPWFELLKIGVQLARYIHGQRGRCGLGRRVDRRRRQQGRWRKVLEGGVVTDN